MVLPQYLFLVCKKIQDTDTSINRGWIYIYDDSMMLDDSSW